MVQFGKESRAARRGAPLLAWLAIATAAAAIAPAPAQGADPLIAAAGDIACAPSDSSFKAGNGTATACRQKYTSDLLVNAGIDTVLALGDNQYDSGSLSDFQRSYDLSWGRVKSITRPVLGNHENSGTGHFDYFNGSGANNGPAGERGKGYYAYDRGAWRLYALNSNCAEVGGCDAGSAQELWLRSDLAAHPGSCKLAYMHHARFSSGHDGDNAFVQPLWQALYEAGANVVLAGHSHDYERFKPMDPTGRLDQANGLRQFVVGTGGAFFTGIGTARPNSEVRQNNTYGVLKMTLHPTSYDWEFVSESGKPFSDSGAGVCAGGTLPPPDTMAPSAPTNLTATASSPIRVDLGWNASSDNVGVTGYEVFRNGTLLATTSGTTFADDTVVAGRTYTYQVKARDLAGNRSAFSNSAAVTTPGTTVKLLARADARVEEASPNANYGGSYLRTDGGSGPDVESYLSVNVNGVVPPVYSAKLRLHASAGTADGPAVYSTAISWSESGITWSSRPARTSGATGDKGAIAANSWAEYDVKPFVTGNGAYGFVLATSSTDGVDFHSREHSDVSFRPELVLTVAGTQPPPDTAITSGPSGSTNSNSATFEFSSTNPLSTFECKLDEGIWTACSSPKSYATLANGVHTFRVFARDQFGSVDQTEATRSWTVAHQPPPAPPVSPSALLLPAPPAPPALVSVDRLPPKLTLGGPAKQRLQRGRLNVVAQCDEACIVVAAASVSLGRASSVFQTSQVVQTLAAGAKAKLTMKLSKKAARAIRRRLARHRRVTATVKIACRDRAGNVTSATRKIRLRP